MLILTWWLIIHISEIIPEQTLILTAKTCDYSLCSLAVFLCLFFVLFGAIELKKYIFIYLFTTHWSFFAPLRFVQRRGGTDSGLNNAGSFAVASSLWAHFPGYMGWWLRFFRLILQHVFLSWIWNSDTLSHHLAAVLNPPPLNSAADAYLNHRRSATSSVPRWLQQY